MVRAIIEFITIIAKRSYELIKRWIKNRVGQYPKSRLNGNIICSK